ncbi:hypothetical protein [Spongorhabdus nitratireducens]
MNKNRCLIALSISLLIGGCASTSDYSESILRLDKAINDSATTIQAIDTDITAKNNAKLKEKIISGELLLETAKGECAAGTNSCSLTVHEARDGENTLVSSYPIQSSMPKGLKALDMVKTYAGRLKSIVEADTAAKVVASANATLGSLEQMTNQLAKENRSTHSSVNKITEYKKPVMGVIEWVTDKYVERVKVEALAQTTQDAHLVIQDLTAFYATAAQSQKLAKFAGQHTVFMKKQETYDDSSATSKSVDAYVSAAADYDVALKAQTANPLKAFEAAHEALMKQLNGVSDEQATLVEVASALDQLEQEVSKIKALIDAFKNNKKETNKGDQS